MKRVRVVVLLVCVLAAIVPSPTVQANLADDIGKVFAGISIIKAFLPISDGELARFGRQADEGLITEYGTTNDGLERVQNVVFRLLDGDPKKPIVRVLRSSDYNAMATPGYTYITDSYLPKLSDDELAGVMGHELTHIQKGHTKKAIKRARLAEGIGGALVIAGVDKDIRAGVSIASVIGLLAYTRNEEWEADQGGVERTAKAGYDPHGLPDALSLLPGGGGVEFLSTHPDLGKRIAQAKKLADELVKAGKVNRPTVPPSREHLAKRRIVLGFIYSGDAYRLQEWFPFYVQSKMAIDGQIDVEASNGELQAIIEAQDRIQDSGRYSPETAGQVPKGQMHAPTDYYQISVRATVNRLNIGVRFKGEDVNVDIEDHVKMDVNLNVQPWDIRAGRLQGGFFARGSASGLDGVRVSAGKWYDSNSVSVFISEIEKTLEGKAAHSAVEDFLRKFSPAPLEVATPTVPTKPAEAKDIKILSDGPSAAGELVLKIEDEKGLSGNTIPIETEPGKRIYLGSQIAFYKGGEEIARYRVIAIRGYVVVVERMFERLRPTNEKFKIL